ncbi:MAG: RluA family pseudouridine synthase [Pirellulales bacterium]|nr:RluA family pseudouridine synthase [Pirellulales bacterium]
MHADPSEAGESSAGSQSHLQWTDLADLTILYENGPCMVVFKPPGLSTQAPVAFDSLELRVKALLRSRAEEAARLAATAGAGESATRQAASDRVYLGVPHRLDRPVSGPVVFALTRRAARRLSKQFERRLVEKVYWVAVAGQVEPESGTWRDIMRKVPYESRAEITTADMPEAKTAVLHYRTLGRGAFGSWLEVRLETGRMHQIRIQAASRGWPVLGDKLYGCEVPYGPATDDKSQQAIALHGRSLAFGHPLTRELVTVVAEPPPQWQALGLTSLARTPA